MFSSTMARDGGDRRHGIEAEAVTGMALQPDRLGMGRGQPDTLELMGTGGIRLGIAVGAGMQFDHRCTDALRRHRVGPDRD